MIKNQFIRTFEEFIIEMFIRMCIESLNPDLFNILVEKIIPYLMESRHLKLNIEEILKE